MTRRFADFSRPRRATTAGEAISAGLGMVLGVIVLVIFGAFLASFFPGKALSHESWISKGSLKNTAGEWCCGDYDCKAYDKAASVPAGWMLDGELVPYDEALPVVPPDGQVTVCRRPDGTRRCVFGVKPGL